MEGSDSGRDFEIRVKGLGFMFNKGLVQKVKG
jgi:hypothetical protein